MSHCEIEPMVVVISESQQGNQVIKTISKVRQFPEELIRHCPKASAKRCELKCADVIRIAGRPSSAKATSSAGRHGTVENL